MCTAIGSRWCLRGAIYWTCQLFGRYVVSWGVFCSSNTNIECEEILCNLLLTVSQRNSHAHRDCTRNHVTFPRFQNDRDYEMLAVCKTRVVESIFGNNWSSTLGVLINCNERHFWKRPSFRVFLVHEQELCCSLRVCFLEVPGEKQRKTRGERKERERKAQFRMKVHSIFLISLKILHLKLCDWNWKNHSESDTIS